MSDMRQSAEDFLDYKIKMAEDKVAQLKVLKKAIDWERLDKDEEEKIWSLFCDLK